MASRTGAVLSGPAQTLFALSPWLGWVGPGYVAISPDGRNETYDGNFEAGYINTSTWWSSTTVDSTPNQSLGQEGYGYPAWIDNSHLLLTNGNQVATYTIGGADNTMIEWFPGSAYFEEAAITRAGDKLAFVGTVDNEPLGDSIIVLYQTTGPPKEAAGDPANVPNEVCEIDLPYSLEGTTSGLPISLSPDGQSLAFVSPTGIHLLSLAGWPQPSACQQGVTQQNEQVIIPGGTQASFGPTDVGPNDGCGTCGTSGTGTGTGTTTTGTTTTGTTTTGTTTTGTTTAGTTTTGTTTTGTTTTTTPGVAGGSKSGSLGIDVVSVMRSRVRVVRVADEG